MNILAKILLIFILFSCACSHTTYIRLKNDNFQNGSLTVDDRNFYKRTSSTGLCLQLSRNAMINVDLQSIANFAQPTTLNRNQIYWSDRNDMHPWVLCNISF